MSNNLLGVSVSGLRVSQTALSTVGHNIANAGTDGYSRQRVEPVTNPAMLGSGGYVGNGAKVESIERIVNQFVIDQMRTDSSLFADLDGYYSKIIQLDNLLSDDSTGLSNSLNSFFSAMQNGSNDPTSIPSRQLILSESQNLADRFNSIYGRMQTIGEGVDDGIEVAVEQINALSANIAQLNLKISDAIGLGNNALPNDLLDQRDQALKDLAALVPLQAFDQSNGQVNVVIGTGQSLVLGTIARTLSVEAGIENGNKLDVYFTGQNQSEVITDVITGGALGGLLRFRDQELDRTYNQLGRVAMVMADTFNQIHQQGIDLDGEFGGLFFYDINSEDLARSRVIGSSTNARPNDREMALYVRETNQLTISDYKVEIENGALYKVTRLSDNTEVATGLMPGRFPFSVEFDGMELAFEKGSFQNGDEFMLLPTHDGGRDFESVLLSAESIAFASPLLTDSSLSNLGDGVISDGEVLSLLDQNGNTLPLFGESGEMNPPLIVVFNSPYSFDILDNSDPGNPVQLDPPMRDNRYYPGVKNQLFSEDPGQTLVSSGGEMIGLPDGKLPITQAVLFPGLTPPDFTVTDFSAPPNQFSFDLQISNTLGGLNNGTFTITVDGPVITDNTALLANINSKLVGSDATAYIADNGALAFKLNTAGYGDIAIQNYNLGAPAGVANNLLGFDVEGSTFTTTDVNDGIRGDGLRTNGYPAESITVTVPSDVPGAADQSFRVITPIGASAKQIASQLSDIPGVEANAFTHAVISDLDLSFTEPMQLSLNGADIIEYVTDSLTGNPILADGVPSPATSELAFYDYLADQINANPQMVNQGIYAIAGADIESGALQLKIYSSEGDDLNIALTAAAGDSVEVSDGVNSPVVLNGAGNSIQSQIYVGGHFDVALANGVALSTFPASSMLFGDTRASDFAKSTYLGIQASIVGKPQAGDTFSLSFNENAASDSRNALSLIQLTDAKILNGGSSTISQSYGTLVEQVGIQANSSKINRDAAERVLEQTENLRNSISGVNLDEEAADLIRFEQMFSANAQVINVARDIFDRLLAAF